MGAALSKRSKLAIGATSTVDQFLTFTRFTPGASVEKLDTSRDVAMGSLAHYVSRVVDNRRMVRPTGSFKPTVSEWAALLPWLSYDSSPDVNGDTSTYKLARPSENAPSVPTSPAPIEKYVDYQLDTYKYFHLSGVAVSKATFQAQSGAELLLDLECVGRDFTNAGTFPTDLAPDLGTAPFLMSKLSLAVGGTSSVKTETFRVELDHTLAAERFFNSDTLPTGQVNTDRVVRLTLALPWGLHAALWDAGAGASGVAVVATFTRGSDTLVLTMPAVVAAAPPPESAVSTPEVMMTWEGTACASVNGDGDYVPELSIAYTVAS